MKIIEENENRIVLERINNPLSIYAWIFYFLIGLLIITSSRDILLITVVSLIISLYILYALFSRIPKKISVDQTGLELEYNSLVGAKNEHIDRSEIINLAYKSVFRSYTAGGWDLVVVTNRKGFLGIPRKILLQRFRGIESFDVSKITPKLSTILGVHVDNSPKKIITQLLLSGGLYIFILLVIFFVAKYLILRGVL